MSGKEQIKSNSIYFCTSVQSAIEKINGHLDEVHRLLNIINKASKSFQDELVSYLENK